MTRMVDKKAKPSNDRSISEYSRNVQEANQALRTAQRTIQQRRENNHRVIQRPKTESK